MKTIREDIENQKRRFREHPVKATVMTAVGILLAGAFWYYTPSVEAKGEVVAPTTVTTTDVPYDPATDPALTQKSCPLDDPCMRTKEKWVSADRMATRFDNGVLKNDKGRVLPLQIRKMATHKWNVAHGFAAEPLGIWDCGDHWWCGPLSAGTCVVSYFLCAAQTIGPDNTRKIVMKCGGTAFLVFGTTESPTAGVGFGSACTYQQLGGYWGLW